MQYKSLIISTVCIFEKHIANKDRSFITIDEHIKKHNNTVYISAQAIRRTLLETMKKMDRNLFFSLPNSKSYDIVKDLRADMFGYYNPTNKSSRLSPIQTNMVFSENESEIIKDVCVNQTRNLQNSYIKQKEISLKDTFHFNYKLDIELLGCEIIIEEIEKGVYIEKLVQKITNSEKKNRILLFINSIINLIGFGYQSNHLINAYPHSLSLFLTKNHENTYMNFFKKNNEEKNILISNANISLVYDIFNKNKETELLNKIKNII